MLKITTGMENQEALWVCNVLATGFPTSPILLFCLFYSPRRWKGLLGRKVSHRSKGAAQSVTRPLKHSGSSWKNDQNLLDLLLGFPLAPFQV